MRTTADSPVDIGRTKRAPTHPGEMLLEEFLEPLGMSQADAARRMKMSANPAPRNQTWREEPLAWPII